MSDVTPVRTTESTGISRRTMTKAMAWAVPVIAVAAAAPAYAASNGLLSFGGTGCKLPGNSNSTYKGYVFALSTGNTTDNDIIITIKTATLDGASLGQIAIANIQNAPGSCPSGTSPFTVAANTQYPRLALLTQNAPNSQNGVLVITYTSSVDNNQTVHTVTATVPAVPPINGAGSCSAFTPGEKACIISV